MNNSIGFDDRIFNFFINLAKEIVKQRKADKSGGKAATKRNDLVQLLMDAYVYESDLKDNNYEKLTASADHDEVEAKETITVNGNGQAPNNSVKRTLDEKEIIAQCLIFFIAGFETTATTLSMAAYFLALNPEVQERLYDELTEALDGLEVNSAEYFEKVNSNQIPYLDAVIKETLRRNPPVARLQRRVGVDNYKLAGIPLEKDIEVQIPTFGIHHNSKFWPDPDRFDPERFMPENKDSIIPYTYLPFGAGPRNCIGMRFAYQEMKLCLAQIARKFRFERTAKTQVPLKIDSLALISSKDIQLRVLETVLACASPTRR
ncbi:PREDICTED: cytochrome P450 3A19-like [Rhagoletis zephyria]|uniref:cytochrome P450 3A19-like n=1 Tax=Rhagoletis zephyria TaxID=28612 RepID=UPI00081170A7|nr:PREDICTED: cytochrome P450 3A19-like [Rhagoletis zephyria]